MLRVLLIGAQCVAGTGFRARLEREPFEVIEAAAAGPEVASLVREAHPDVVVMVHQESGVAAAAAIHEAQPEVPVILVTASATERELGEALAAGVRGCVFDAESVEGVVRAVHAVANGGAFLSLGPSRVLFERYLKPPSKGVKPRAP